MKNKYFLVLVSLVYCIASISCKESKRNTSQIQLFQDSVADTNYDSHANDMEDIPFQNIDPDPDRGSWQNPDLVIQKLGTLSDKVVADIGSGTGYFAIPISRYAESVIAIDIEQRYLDYIEERKLELPIEQADKIETRLTVENEPNLHAAEVNAVLMVNVYYYLNNKTNYMQIVKQALRKNGILVLVDFKLGDMPVGPVNDKLASDEVVSVLRSAGFNEIIVDEQSLRYQYIITAK